MQLPGSAGVLNCQGIVAGGGSGLRGALPQPACGSRPIGRVVRYKPGGGGIAGGGQGGGTGALGCPGQRRDRLGADFSGIGIIRSGVQRIQVVAGDHVGDLLAAAGEAGPQVLGNCEVAGLAVTPRQSVVGDLAEHRLGEPVTAPLRR